MGSATFASTFNSTFNYRLVQRVHVAVHTQHSPNDQEWLAYLGDLDRRMEGIDAIYSFTVGGGPNGSQREQSVSFWKGQRRQPPIAVVTPSVLVVRMAGALRWFMPSQIKAFIPRDVPRAFDYLKLTAEQRDAVTRMVKDLAREQSVLIPE